MARVNAYLYLLRRGRPQNPKYTTDYDLLPKDHPKSTRGNATASGFDLNKKIDGGVAMDTINKDKIVEHSPYKEEEVAAMAWSCDGMEHAECEQQEDGSWMCDGMEHSNCEKVEDMKYPKDEEDMSGHDDEEDMSKHDDEEKMSVNEEEENMDAHEDEEDMSGHDDEEDMDMHEDEEDMDAHEDEEDMDAHEDEEKMSGHDDEEEEENMKFMRNPLSEIEKNVAKQFREAMGDNMYIVQWSMFDDMIAFYNMNDGEYYRVDFVMNEETEELTFGEPELVKARYLTESEIDQLFPEQPRDRGGQLENATNTSAENTAEQKGVLLSESEAEQFKKDMAELQAFRKEDKLKLIATFEELVDKEVIASVSEQVNELTKDELETKLSVEAMKKIKAEKELDKAQTINPVKFYAGVQKNHANENPVVSLIDQWKDKK
jgi:hypothetical protein